MAKKMHLDFCNQPLSFLTLVMLVASVVSAYGQTPGDLSLDEIADDPIPPVVFDRFKPRPKFIEYNIQTFSEFGVEATSDLIGDEQATVRQNLIREFKVRFPLILKEKTTLIGGLGYRHEQFKFDDQSDLTYPFFERFDDRSLNRSSLTLVLRQKLRQERFMIGILNGSLNSDERTFDHFGRQLKLSIITIIGKNINPNKQIGYGISFGYDFGQPAIFPIFMLNNDLSDHWGYELLLPKSMKMRYSPNADNQFFAALELKGASYNLQNYLLDGYDNLEFRRSSIRLSLTYERELYDWLWFGVAGGYRYPINIFISEPRKRREDALILIDSQRAAYLDLSIFIVPPEKLYNKVR